MKRAVAILLASIVGFFGLCYGEDKKAEETGTLEEVVVTATRSEERIIDVPASTDIISKEQIEMSGVTTLGDLIGKYSTGHYHRYSGMLSPLGLRGFITDAHGDDLKGHVLILVDGHRIGTGNAAKINVDRIERVEIIKGPASALYGSAAMGGVINIITKKGEGPLSAKVGIDYGSFDYYKGKVSAGGELNERLKFHLATSYEDVGDYKAPDFGKVYNSSETRKEIGGNITYQLLEGHEVRFGGNFADLTGEYPKWKGYLTYSSYDEKAKQDFDKSHRYADLEYNGDFLDGKIHWRALGYYLWDRNHWNWGDPDPKVRQTKYTDTTWGTDHQIVWKIFDWNKLTFGFNIESLEKKSEAISNYEPSVPYTPNLDYDSKALFIQESLELWNNRVNIVASARYDRFDVSTKPPETGTMPYFQEKSETFDHISPKGGVAVKFFDELLRVRANIGEGFKSPSADQLSADYIHNNIHYRGNPDLEPETSLTYDLGFDIFHELFTLKFTYFHTDYKDKIVQKTINTGSEPVITWENRGKAEMAGIEIGPEVSIGKIFSLPFDVKLWSNVAINTQKKDKETDEDLLYISDYEVKSGIDVSYKGLTAQLSYIVIGPQKITNYDVWPYRVETKDAFEFWDLTVRYRFFDTSYKFLEGLEVFAGLFNIFNDRVEWVRGYPMAERSFKVGLSYTF